MNITHRASRRSFPEFQRSPQPLQIRAPRTNQPLRGRSAQRDRRTRLHSPVPQLQPATRSLARAKSSLVSWSLTAMQAKNVGHGQRQHLSPPSGILGRPNYSSREKRDEWTIRCGLAGNRREGGIASLPVQREWPPSLPATTAAPLAPAAGPGNSQRASAASRQPVRTSRSQAALSADPQPTRLAVGPMPAAMT